VSWRQRFGVRGVFWRQLLRWATINVPTWVDPPLLGLWAGIFLLMWRDGRRGVMHNLRAIKPGSSWLTNFPRAYRVFWNFAWTIADNVRFKELRATPDWDFAGMEHFDALQARPGGAIILTAHMGSYDLGAQLFAETTARRIVMVRAPEADPETRKHEEELHRRTVGDAIKIDFSTRASDLALDLLHAVQAGEIVAIQGDRVTPGISSLPATLFGKESSVPAGPFALAMAAHVPIYPLFIIRLGRRSYRLLVCAPIEVRRTRDRAEGFRIAVEEWTQSLESVIATSWYQWFQFAPFYEERAA
jgi:phosphatidylinositol dimannoside acyltransferase